MSNNGNNRGTDKKKSAKKPPEGYKIRTKKKPKPKAGASKPKPKAGSSVKVPKKNKSKQSNIDKILGEGVVETKIPKIPKPKKQSKRPRLKKVIRIACMLILLTGIITGGIAFGVGYQIFADARENTIDVSIGFQNSVVKDIHGNIIATLSGDENREIITLEEMSDYIPMAFVAIEDERFFEHMGVDFRRTAAATFNFIRGDVTFGGSTITQQLIKNITNEDDVSWRRKADEIARAYFLERELSKDQILETYLNVIFLGSRAHGVQVAANFYFNKDASEITLAEAAFLAGVAHMPNAYIPFGNEEDEAVQNRIRVRTITVLDKMLELEKITLEEFNEARAIVENGLPFYEGAIVETVFSYHTDAAIMQIIDLLRTENDWTHEAARRHLFSGGFTIYTTQDTAMQAQLEAEMALPNYRIASRRHAGVTSQASMTIIDHSNGFVLATVGGLGEKTEAFGLNRSTQHQKQTGSAMKPITVLGPGIDQGIITAGSVYEDAEFTVGGVTFRNQDRRFRGNMTMRDASAQSTNIPFLKAVRDVGTDRAMQFSRDVGISRIVEADNNMASLALGGLTRGSNTLEMAAAYAVFANGGVYIEPTFFTRVVDSNGNTVRETQRTERRVMSEAAAFVVTDILIETGRTGTATHITVPGMQIASKTGTTNNDHDRWFVAYTPHLTGAVWFGFDENETVHFPGRNPATLIWQGAMRRVHEGREPRSFVRPEGVVNEIICRESGLRATDACTRLGRSYSEMFVRGTVPASQCEACGGRISLEPTITLNGASEIRLTVGDVYVEFGATAYDPVDGDLTASILISGGAINTSRPGTHTITYTVTNGIGTTVSVTRTVIVSAAVVPEPPISQPPPPPPDDDDDDDDEHTGGNDGDDELFIWD